MLKEGSNIMSHQRLNLNESIMFSLLWPQYSQIKLERLSSQRFAALCVHAHTPTNLVASLIMEGECKIMTKHGGL